MSKLHSMPTHPKFQDLTGRVFGRLTVESYQGLSPQGKSLWGCLCICGGQKVIVGGSLQSGRTTSCGCLRPEVIKTHGLSNSPEYVSWYSMWQRCENPEHPAYPRYRGRKPPESWRDFLTFLKDMGPKPSPEHTLDRVKNHLPYGPANCRWATKLEQGQNSSRNVNLTYQGKTQGMAAWSRELGGDSALVYRRLTAGWGLERTLTTHVHSRA